MILLYKGARGRGKTLTMVKDGFIYFKNGFRILRNFEASFGEYITNDEILQLDKNSNIINCVLLIDEIQIFFDSRRSMKKENMNFSNFVQQTRKRNINLLCTTQYSNTIDLRLRQHLDIIAIPQFSKEFNLCEVDYIDITSYEDVLTGLLDNVTKKTIVYDAIPIFKLYKTEEMII